MCERKSYQNVYQVSPGWPVQSHWLLPLLWKWWATMLGSNGSAVEATTPWNESFFSRPPSGESKVSPLTKTLKFSSCWKTIFQNSCQPNIQILICWAEKVVWGRSFVWFMLRTVAVASPALPLQCTPKPLSQGHSPPHCHLRLPSRSVTNLELGTNFNPEKASQHNLDLRQKWAVISFQNWCRG